MKFTKHRAMCKSKTLSPDSHRMRKCTKHNENVVQPFLQAPEIRVIDLRRSVRISSLRKECFSGF